tara:strand:+ start:703 stop:1074 length:372 start_codon:yes stop_codon:yes gene_type:complete
MSDPTAPAAPAATKSTTKSTIKKKRGLNPRRAQFGSYTHAVMKQTDPAVSIASDAMLVVDGVLLDFADRLMAKSFKMAKYDSKSTLKPKHVRASVYNMLRGELAKCAVAEGEKALARFSQSGK